MKTVREAWESYSKDVLPKDAHPTQRIETRRAFYAGAYSLLMQLVDTIGDESVSEAQGIEQLEGLRAECEEFYARVNAGRA